MTKPTLTCPTCRTEIKLTESLAAPLIADTRRRFEDQLARKEAEVAGREAAIRQQQAQIAAAKDSIDDQVAAKVDEERGRIAAAVDPSYEAVCQLCHRQCKSDPGGNMNLTHRVRWFLLSGGADAEGGGADGIGGFEEARG